MKRFLLTFLFVVALGAATGAGYATGRGYPVLPGWMAEKVATVLPWVPSPARSAALLGSVLMGLMQDILTTTPLGTYGFAYGMVALLIVSVQQVVHREHPVTHFSLSLIGSIMTGLVLMGVGWRHGSMPAVLALLVQSLLTAALSVPVVWLLMRFRKAFAFDGSRRRFG